MTKLIDVQSIILEYILSHSWTDYKRYANKVSKEIINKKPSNKTELSKILDSNPEFFYFNEISKSLFLKYFPYEAIFNVLNEIDETTKKLPALRWDDIFNEIIDVSYEEAVELTDLLDIPERQIQDLLRTSLREKGATNMVQRKSDTVLEVADLEDFTLTVKGKEHSFTSVVKGYRSLKKKTATLEEIMHQIIKANVTNPDYIILVLAKPPGDGVISYLIKYGTDIGNRNLIILADPVELARFLRFKQII